MRMLILKRLRDWSFDECEREVRASPILKDLVPQLVPLGRARRVIQRRRLRVDTIVVETNIRYPTDDTLLATASGRSRWSRAARLS